MIEIERENPSGYTKISGSGELAFRYYNPRPLQKVNLEFDASLKAELNAAHQALACLVGRFVGLEDEAQKIFIKKQIDAENRASIRLSMDKNPAGRANDLGTTSIDFPDELGTTSQNPLGNQGLTSDNPSGILGLPPLGSENLSLLEVFNLQMIQRDFEGEFGPKEKEDLLWLEEASEFACDRIRYLPLSKWLLLEIHEHIMHGFHNEDAKPGKFHRSPNWIVKRETGIGNVVKELEEVEEPTGSFYCEFPVFKKIFELELRRQQRLGKSASFVLISVAMKKDLQEYEDMKEYHRSGERAVAWVKRCLNRKIRIGDIFTRYSSSQILVLLPECKKDQTEMVMARVLTAYMSLKGASEATLNYEIQEMSAYVPIKAMVDMTDMGKNQ